MNANQRIRERIQHRQFLRDLKALTRLTPDCRTGAQMCLIGQYAMKHAGTHAFDGIPGVHFLGGQFAEHREAVYDRMEELIALGQRHDLLPEQMPFRRMS
ncbi:hypothetical protein PUR29_35225 [Methylobacterium ajmalii]|uniref:Uncharacterized protein n=1 Tax=Methylobacterium ajmalii TaxID=2738439 RepID=A0ABV0A645_9HYPH